MTEPDARVINLGHENVAIEKLRPHPQNPRQADIGAIYESIRINGFYGTLIVKADRNEKGEFTDGGVILAGNHRREAAESLGYTSLPVSWVDCNEQQATKILLADNRTNDLADYDQASLSSLLKSIVENDEDLSGTGYDNDDLDQLLADMEFQDVGAIEGTDERQWNPEERYENQYMTTDLRQIIVLMHSDQYSWALGILKEIQAAEDDVGTNAEAVIMLLSRWKEEHGGPTRPAAGDEAATSAEAEQEAD